MDNNLDDLESNIIQTKDENGETQSFELVDVFKVKDKDYAALIRVNEDGTPLDEEEEELILMRLIEEEDNYTFEEIEDDDEFNAVVDAFENEMDDEEEEYSIFCKGSIK